MTKIRMSPDFGKDAKPGVEAELGYSNDKVVWSKKVPGTTYQFQITLTGTTVKLWNPSTHPQNQWEGKATSVEVDWGDGSKTRIYRQLINSGRFNKSKGRAIEHYYDSSRIGDTVVISVTSVEPLFPIGARLLTIEGELPEDIYQCKNKTGEIVGLFGVNVGEEPEEYPTVSQFLPHRSTISSMGKDVWKNMVNTDLTRFFQDFTALVAIPEGFLVEEVLGRVTTYERCFENTPNVKIFPSNLLGTENHVVQNMNYMFHKSGIPEALSLRRANELKTLEGCYAETSFSTMDGCFLHIPKCTTIEMLFKNAKLVQVGASVFSENIDSLAITKQAFYNTNLQRIVWPKEPGNSLRDASEMFAHCGSLEQVNLQKLFTRSQKMTGEETLCIDSMFLCSGTKGKGIQTHQLGLSYQHSYYQLKENRISRVFYGAKIDTTIPVQGLFHEFHHTPTSYDALFAMPEAPKGEESEILLGNRAIHSKTCVSSTRTFQNRCIVRTGETVFGEAESLKTVDESFAGCLFSPRWNSPEIGTTFRPTWFQEAPNISSFQKVFANCTFGKQIHYAFDSFIRSTNVNEINIKGLFASGEHVGLACYHPVHHSVPTTTKFIVDRDSFGNHPNVPISYLLKGYTYNPISDEYPLEPTGIHYDIVLPTNRTIHLIGHLDSIQNVDWGDGVTNVETQHSYSSSLPMTKTVRITIWAKNAVWLQESDRIVRLDGEFPYDSDSSSGKSLLHCQWIGRRVFGLVKTSTEIEIDTVRLENKWEQGIRDSHVRFTGNVANPIFTAYAQENGDLAREADALIGLESRKDEPQRFIRRRYDYYKIYFLATEKNRTKVSILTGGTPRSTQVEWYRFHDGKKGTVTISSSTEIIPGEWEIGDLIGLTFYTKTAAWWLQTTEDRETITHVMGTFPSHTFVTHEKFNTIAPKIDTIGESFLWLCENTDWSEMFAHTELKYIPSTLLQYSKGTNYRRCFYETQIKEIPKRLLYLGIDHDLDCTEMFARCFYCTRVENPFSRTHTGTVTVTDMFANCKTPFYNHGSNVLVRDEELLYGITRIGESGCGSLFYDETITDRSMVVWNQVETPPFVPEVVQVITHDQLVIGDQNYFYGNAYTSSTLQFHTDIEYHFMISRRDALIMYPYVQTLKRPVQEIFVAGMDNGLLWSQGRILKTDLFQNITQWYAPIAAGIFHANRFKTFEQMFEGVTYHASEPDCISRIFDTDCSYLTSMERFCYHTTGFSTIGIQELPSPNNVSSWKEAFVGSDCKVDSSVIFSMAKENSIPPNTVRVNIQRIFMEYKNQLVLGSFFDTLVDICQERHLLLPEDGIEMFYKADVVMNDPDHFCTKLPLTSAERMFCESTIHMLPRGMFGTHPMNMESCFEKTNITSIPEGYFRFQVDPSVKEVNLRRCFAFCYGTMVPKDSGTIQGNPELQIDVEGMYQEVLSSYSDQDTLQHFKTPKEFNTKSRYITDRVHITKIRVDQVPCLVEMRTLAKSMLAPEEALHVLYGDGKHDYIPRDGKFIDDHVLFRHEYTQPGDYEITIVSFDTFIYPHIVNREQAKVLQLIEPFSGGTVEEIIRAGGLQALYGKEGLQEIVLQKGGLFTHMMDKDVVTSLEGLCEGLQDLNTVSPILLQGLGNKITNVSRFFKQAKKLRVPTLTPSIQSILDTSASEILADEFFYEVPLKKEPDEGYWSQHDSPYTSVRGMFYDCGLEEADTEKLILPSKVKDASYLFYNCKLPVRDTASFTTILGNNVELEHIDYMFYNVPNPLPDTVIRIVGNKLRTAKYFFARKDCVDSYPLDASKWEWHSDVLEDIEGMFQKRNNTGLFPLQHCQNVWNFSYLYQENSLTEIPEAYLQYLPSHDIDIRYMFSKNNIIKFKFPIRKENYRSWGHIWYTLGCFEDILLPYDDGSLFAGLTCNPSEIQSKAYKIAFLLHQHISHVAKDTSVTLRSFFEHLNGKVEDYVIGLEGKHLNDVFYLDWGDGTIEIIRDPDLAKNTEVTKFTHTYTQEHHNIIVSLSTPFACYVDLPTETLSGSIGYFFDRTLTFKQVDTLKNSVKRIEGKDFFRNNAECSILDELFEDCVLEKVSTDVFHYMSPCLSAIRTFANCKNLQTSTGYLPKIVFEKDASVESTWENCKSLTNEDGAWIAIDGQIKVLLNTWKGSGIQRLPIVQDISNLTIIDGICENTQLQKLTENDWTAKEFPRLTSAVRAFYNTPCSDFTKLLWNAKKLSHVIEICSESKQWRRPVQALQLLNRWVHNLDGDTFNARNAFSYCRSLGTVDENSKNLVTEALALGWSSEEIEIFQKIEEYQISIPATIDHLILEGTFLECYLHGLHHNIIVYQKGFPEELGDDEMSWELMDADMFEDCYMSPLQRQIESRYSLGAPSVIQYTLRNPTTKETTIQLGRVLDTTPGSFYVTPRYIRVYLQDAKTSHVWKFFVDRDLSENEYYPSFTIPQGTNRFTVECDKFIVVKNLTDELIKVTGSMSGAMYSEGRRLYQIIDKSFRWKLVCPNVEHFGVKPGPYQLYGYQQIAKDMYRDYREWCKDLKKMKSVDPTLFVELRGYYHIHLEEFFMNSGIQIGKQTPLFLEPLTHAESLARMFKNCLGVTHIPSGFLVNQNEVEDFTEMFAGCRNLQSIPRGLVYIRKTKP